MNRSSRPHQAYKQGKELTSKPFSLIIDSYSTAIEACLERNEQKAKKAFGKLREILNVQWKNHELSLEVNDLYLYCEKLIMEEEYEKALPILNRLRRHWIHMRDLSTRINVMIN